MWYAVKLHYSSQVFIEDYFQKAGVECFVPREYVTTVNKEGHRHKQLKPVVRNLIFIRKLDDESLMQHLIDLSPKKLFIIRKTDNSKSYAIIADNEMDEFKAMCNPDILMRKYLSENEAILKVGTPVEVTHGPLKGLTGRLVRSNKKYFLLKEVPGMAVMLKVTRWCCKAIATNS